MHNLKRTFLLLVAVTTVAVNCRAFSLMGPFASWQSAALGYTGTGGPMALGEEYRLTVPVLTYGFDGTFLNFFGASGVTAVNSAFGILNAVPAASAMPANLTGAGFPSRSLAPPNPTATNLRILDLRSAVLATMMGQMGLASPERWVWTLRDRAVVGTATNYTVIQRNYDPVTWQPTDRVNDALYNYTISDTGATASTSPFVRTGDANSRSVASVEATGLPVGQYFTSLTRDDLGGLRYLLRFNNVNTETLQANAILANISSPYAPVQGTNLVNTNTPIATARRPGINKISFSSVGVDALLNVTIQPVTNRYTDTFYHPTNGYLTNQVLERITTIPDIIFTAADLTGTALNNGATFTGATSARWTSFATLNSAVASTAFGPGVIPAGTSNATAIVITFNSLGPSRLNVRTAGNQFLDQFSPSTNSVWGYFDTVIHSVFPDGTTIQALERQLYGP